MFWLWTFISLKSLFSFIACLAFVGLFVKFYFEYWSRLGVYQECPSWIYGDIEDLFKVRLNEAELYDRIYKNCRDIKYAGVYFFFKKMLLVTDPHFIKDVMVKDFDHFVDHPSISDYSSTDKVAYSLFTMEGPLWKHRRALFSGYFTPKKLKEHFHSIKGNSRNIVSLLQGNTDKDVELESLASRYSIDIILNTLFGLKADTLENPDSKFINCGKLVTNPPLSSVVKIMVHILTPTIYSLLKLQSLPTYVYECFNEFIRDIIKIRQENNIKNDDMIETMIKYRENPTPDKPVMTIDEMAGHMFAFFEAGYDSTTLTTAYALYELSRNPGIQNKLREEIDEVLTEESSYEDYQKMPYMDKVIKETLRKYPPSGVIKRVCTKDYKLDCLYLKKGTPIIIPVNSIHHDPEYYPHPEVFNPEREFNSLTYLPFGAGPRICIGMKLAELSIKIGLATILKEFEILPSGKHSGPVQFDPKNIFITIRPLNGVWVKLKKRN